MNKQFYILMMAIVVAVSAFLFFIKDSDAFTYKVLLYGNLVIFILSILSYAISSRYAKSESNSAFMRGVLGGTFLKFFLAIIIALIYIVMNKGNLNVADIIGLMILYIIYTSVETAFLAKSSRVK